MPIDVASTFKFNTDPTTPAATLGDLNGIIDALATIRSHHESNLYQASLRGQNTADLRDERDQIIRLQDTLNWLRVKAMQPSHDDPGSPYYDHAD